MNSVPWPGYLAIALGSAILTLGLTPAARALAVRFDALDRPGGYKAQVAPVPYLGGLAVVVAFSAVVLAAAALRPPTGGIGELAAILGLAVGVSIVGLIDDLRGLGPWIRLGLHAAAALAIVGLGEGVAISGVGWLDGTLTVVWTVGVTNAFNLLDNMDGLSAGVAAVSAGWFLVIAGINGQFLVASLSAALAGCALGFLRHNFHPARIYMGDAGSVFLGFLLAVLGIKLRFAGPNEVTFVVPVLVLAVALFDTALVTIARVRHGRRVLSGGRDHTSHRLVLAGLDVPRAVALLYAAAFACGALGLIVSRAGRATGLSVAGAAVIGGIVIGVMLEHVPVYGVDPVRRARAPGAEAGEGELSPGAPS